MPYFGNKLTAFCFKIIIGKLKVHRKVSVITMKVLEVIKTYYQNMA
jgi:hypothetical protein